MGLLTFNLIRYFSLLTSALILITGLVMGELMRQHQTENLIRMAEDRNVAMTRIFRNALWPDFSPLLLAPASGSDAKHQALRSRVVALMDDSDTIKIKVYNPDGLTVFSTDPAQTGENKQGNRGFIAARSGQVVSELTHRNQIDSFEGTLQDRDVMASYVPVFEHGRLTGVIESYQDVTRFVQQIGHEQARIAGVIFGALGILYLLQLLVVHRAHRLIRTQEEALEDANRELDRRVSERTRELAEANQQLEQEVAEHRRTQGRLEYLSYYDAQTNLPNRPLLLNRLKKALAASAGNGQQGALLFVDLDHFRTINDTEGRAQGDELLAQVSRRLLSCVRESDTVARLGNDQFMVMLEDLGRTRTEAATQAEATGDEILARLRQPAAGEGRPTSCSIGIALFGERGSDPDNITKQAELAMYDAKDAGRGTLRFFDPDMQAAATARATLERDFREALATGQFLLHYQAQVGADRRIRGAEALVRWQHPQRGLVPPAEFIPFAEESGLIIPLGQWILESACDQLAAWHATPELAGIAVAVNVSARQFRQPGFVEEVLELVGRKGVAAHRLKLEITESVLLDDLDDIVRKMQALRAHGIGFALDDFGTGYSSLSYLARLPLDQIKIDRSFVSELDTRDQSAVLCASIISLARNLKLQIIAEGVETAAQIYFLTTVHHCDLMQGYHFSRPIPAEAFENLVRGA